MPENDQHVSGLTCPCCGSMRMALSCGYIEKGYLWHRGSFLTWMPWRFDISMPGVRDVSPIHFCPFCGTDLDSEE